MSIKDLKYVYGIVWAFKTNDSIEDIAYALKVKKMFVEAIIREYMVEGEI